MDIGIVFLAAGMSSRFGFRSKSLEEIWNKKSLIEYSIDQALAAGFNRIYIIINEKEEEGFKKKLGDSYKDVPIIYVKQYFNKGSRDKPWGQTDALCKLEGMIDIPFVVCNGDDIYGFENFKLLHSHLQNPDNLKERNAASILYRLGEVLPETGLVNRGIFREIGGEIKGIIEKKGVSLLNLKDHELSPDSKCSMAIFALYPETISSLNKNLSEFKELNKGNRSIEYTFGNALSKIIEERGLKMMAYPSKSGWIGLTNPSDVEEVRGYLQRDS